MLVLFPGLVGVGLFWLHATEGVVDQSVVGLISTNRKHHISHHCTFLQCVCMCVCVYVCVYVCACV